MGSKIPEFPLEQRKQSIPGFSDATNLLNSPITHSADGEAEDISSLSEKFFQSVNKRVSERKPLRSELASRIGVSNSPAGKSGDFDVACASPGSYGMAELLAPETRALCFGHSFKNHPFIFRVSPETETDEIADVGERRISSWQRIAKSDSKLFRLDDPFTDVLKSLLEDPAIASREGYTGERESIYQSKTGGLDRQFQFSLLPRWGRTDPYAMGAASVDQCIRKFVAAGVNPDSVAIQPTFCLSNADQPAQLGILVEAVKGIAKSAEVYQLPILPAKCFETKSADESFPVTALISGVAEEENTCTSSELDENTIIAVIGATENPIGGSILARKSGLIDACVPGTNLRKNIALYRTLYDALKLGWIQFAGDINEGGLAVALAKLGFASENGLDIDLGQLPINGQLSRTSMLFSETPGRFVVGIKPKFLHMVEAVFAGQTFGQIGKFATDHRNLQIKFEGNTLIDEPVEDLQSVYDNGLSSILYLPEEVPAAA